MDLTFSAEDAAFRDEVRAFLRDATPKELKYKVENGIEMKRSDVLQWHRILYEKGWVAPNWPAEHGGPGWTLNQTCAGKPVCID